MSIVRHGLLGAAMALVAGLAQPVAAQLRPPPTEAELLAKGGKAVDEAALRALGSDMTLWHTQAATGQVHPIYYRADGTRLLRLGVSVRTTRWSVKDGLRCDESVSGQTQCARVVALADTYWVCRAGGAWCEWTFVARPGDGEGMVR